jgi:hypothetical protein
MRKTAILQEQTTDEIHQDRRTKRRYALDLPVQFKIMKNYLVVGTGTGTTLDMSSSGIAFTTSQPLKVGSYLEMSVNWPVLLNQSCPLKLVAFGKVVRSDAGRAAVRMDRHEFRTQSLKSAQAAQTAGFALASPMMRAAEAGYRQ